VETEKRKKKKELEKGVKLGKQDKRKKKKNGRGCKESCPRSY
jgi:hypothetical protein